MARAFALICQRLVELEPWVLHGIIVVYSYLFMIRP